MTLRKIQGRQARSCTFFLAYGPPSRSFQSERTRRDLSEPMMPHHRRPNQVRIRAERGEQQLRLFKRNEAATLADGLANAIKKKIGILHDAAAQNDCVRSEQIDQIGEAKPQTPGFTAYCRAGQLIAFDCQLTDALGSQPCAMRIVWGRGTFEPSGHCRTRGQRLPASPKTARTAGARWVEHLMANFGMSSFYTSV